MKFGTKLGNDKLYCVTKNQPHIAYQSLYLSIFLSLTKFSVTDFSLLFELESLNFVYNMRTTKCNTENKTKVLRFIFPSFSIFSFFNLSLQGNEYGNFRQRFLRNYLT